MFVEVKIGNRTRNLKPGFYKLMNFDKSNQILHLEETTTKKRIRLTPGCLEMILNQGLGDITAIDKTAAQTETPVAS
jgi:hypothetical protein